VILQVLFNEKPDPVSEISPQKISPKLSSEIFTQTDIIPQTPEESQFYIIEEFTNDDESKQDDESQESMDADQNQITIIEEEEISTKERTRRKFDRFDCYLCKDQLPGNFQFVQHFKKEHKDEEIKYQCYICNGFVKKYRSFTRHIESHIEKRFA
jgi:hypothetical protein